MKIRLMEAGGRAQRKVRAVASVLREKRRIKTALPPKTAARIAKKDA
tara:strand:+ start:979 stop:1119 length:141 start_codon:yes stop_codon:yes gene_type:complete